MNNTICGSVALSIRSPNFSIFRQAWKGNCNSEPLITMLGKSSKWTSSGSNIPFLVTIICLGCSSTGNDLIRAATSSAVFHFANCWTNYILLKLLRSLKHYAKEFSLHSNKYNNDISKPWNIVTSYYNELYICICKIF